MMACLQRISQSHFFAGPMDVITPRPVHRSSKRLALDRILKSLQEEEDCFSGSECSSFAATPVEEKEEPEFDSGPLPSRGRQANGVDGQNDSKERNHIGSRGQPEPKSIVERLLADMSKADVIEELIADEAELECFSQVINQQEKLDVEPNANVDGYRTPIHSLLASLHGVCSPNGLQIDNVFSLGNNVAVFGRFSYKDRTLNLMFNGRFSVHARVNEARSKIVHLRWMDQAA